MPFLFSALVALLMVVALVDIITRADDGIRFMPKLAWAIVVILLPLLGSMLWFGLGRDYNGQGISMPRMRPPRTRVQPPVVAPAPPADTRTTEQQIADLDREIEEWRLRQEVEKRKLERGED